MNLTELEYMFGPIAVSVGSVVDNGRNNLYNYTDFAVTVESGKVFRFAKGFITTDHLAGFSGTAEENIASFFENLARSYDARDKGEEDTYLANIGL